MLGQPQGRTQIDSSCCAVRPLVTRDPDPCRDAPIHRCCRYSNHLFMIVTQYNKIGSLVRIPPAPPLPRAALHPPSAPTFSRPYLPPGAIVAIACCRPLLLYYCYYCILYAAGTTVGGGKGDPQSLYKAPHPRGRLSLRPSSPSHLPCRPYPHMHPRPLSCWRRRRRWARRQRCRPTASNTCSEPPTQSSSMSAPASSRRTSRRSSPPRCQYCSASRSSRFAQSSPLTPRFCFVF